MNNYDTELILSFDIHSLWRDFKKNLWTIALAALIAVMSMYIVSHNVYTPAYTSSATLVVRAKVGTSGTYTNLSASSEMANLFVKVFEQPATGRLAAEYLGEASFDGKVSASVMGSTNLLKLSVTAEDPELSFRLLNAVLEIYPEISSSVFSDAVIDVMLEPKMPMAPSNAISNKRQALIVLVVMGVQFCLIALLSCLRNTVKNEKLFTQSIDAKLLGTIAHESPHLSFQEKLVGKKRGLLISDGYSSLKFSEDYQKIATKLEWLKKTTRSKIFTVTSVGENEGKSTSASNIAIALAGRGYRVMLLDLDLRKPSLFKIFRYRQILTPEIANLFSKSPEITRDFVETFRYKNSNLYLALNKKRHIVDSEWINSQSVHQWIQAFANEMDFVILDTAPLAVSADAVGLAAVADQTIMVVRTDRSKVEDINDATATITASGGTLAGCILNDVYKPFTLFDQIGTDAGGYYNDRYGSYKRYGHYSRNTAWTGAEKEPNSSLDANQKNGRM